MRSLIGLLRDWRRAYQEALARWRFDKSTVFPFGTWWLVQRANAAFDHFPPELNQNEPFGKNGAERLSL